MHISPHTPHARLDAAPRPADAKATTSSKSPVPAASAVAKLEGKQAVDGKTLKQRQPSTPQLLEQFMEGCASRLAPAVREEIEEYLDHSEWGLAYEGILGELQRGRVQVDAFSLQILAQAADLMDLPRPPSGR